MNIRQANEEDIQDVGRLFDLYRQFYQCGPDIDLATKFIAERIRNRESTIFIAEHEGAAKGFVQLYPSFCSVDAVRIYILYDLYVESDSRNAGTGALLMNRAADHARDQGASRVDLLTAHSNKPGQHLYEKLGYRKVLEDFYAYSLQL